VKSDHLLPVRSLDYMHPFQAWLYRSEAMTKRHLNVQDVLRLIEREVQQAGGQSAWARRTGVNRTYLNKLLQGRRQPGLQIPRALGLKKVVTCAEPVGKDFLRLLRKAVDEAGGISAWSRQTGIDRSVTSLVINGKRAPSSPLFRALKLRKITLYVTEGKTNK
jgi:DNA-binding phage protein